MQWAGPVPSINPQHLKSSSHTTSTTTRRNKHHKQGLLYYLPAPAVAALLGGVLARAAPGSRVAFDALTAAVFEGASPPPPAYEVTARSVANKGEPFVSALPDSAAAMQAYFDADVAAAAGEGGRRRRLRLVEFVGPKEMCARQLPHLQWPTEPAAGASGRRAAPPPMLSFYNFVVAEVVAVEEEGEEEME